MDDSWARLDVRERVRLDLLDAMRAVYAAQPKFIGDSSLSFVSTPVMRYRIAMEPLSPHLPGTHLLIDFYGAAHLTNAREIEASMRSAAMAAEATVIAAHFHSFSGQCGVTGMLLLAESHISIHTWPELEYAAIDIFMCGDADAHAARLALEKAMAPTRVDVMTVPRRRAQRNQ
jgi:S-adenosylmethionine decarboxylase